jgi:biopolymer transport protein ExbD
MKSPLELRSSNVISQINVTPMVDVMLVLLIIFMVVTPAIVAGFQVQLPRGEHLRERPEYEQRVVLGIDAEGRYYLNKAPIARDQALDLLTAAFADRPLDKVLFIKAHRSLEYQEILTAMATARAAGARVVAAVTEQRAPSLPDRER